MKQNLRIPGPTPLPEQVIQAMSRDMIDHRGPEFRDILLRCTSLLRKFYQTSGDVLTFPASGTGGLEAAVVNCFSPGEAVLAVSIGVFGDRFARIAEAYGLDVRRLSVPRGRAVEPRQLAQTLDENSDVVGVLLTHNETSTGVTNPLDALVPLVKDRGLLLILDAVSSMGALPVRTDELGLDVVISASQKAWMSPPGLASVSVSDRAWKSVEKARLPRFYWDFRTARSSLEKGQTPFTPPVSVFFALDVALQMMNREGIERIWERHAQVGAYTRGLIVELGLSLFSDKRYASNVVTAVKMPEGVDGQALRARLLDEYGVVIGGGQAEMAGRVLRLGHLGYVTERDIDEAVEALRQGLQYERSAVVPADAISPEDATPVE